MRNRHHSPADKVLSDWPRPLLSRRGGAQASRQSGCCGGCLAKFTVYGVVFAELLQLRAAKFPLTPRPPDFLKLLSQKNRTECYVVCQKFPPFTLCWPSHAPAFICFPERWASSCGVRRGRDKARREGGTGGDSSWLLYVTSQRCEKTMWSRCAETDSRATPRWDSTNSLPLQG